MTSRPRYLTKSRFKLAAECPTKLFYTGKEDVYRNTKQEDSFMAMLADGGYQVGELAKCYYPEGVEVSAIGHEEALAQTALLLQRDKVTVFEAAIRYGCCTVCAATTLANASSSVFRLRTQYRPWCLKRTCQNRVVGSRKMVKVESIHQDRPER
jgi:hypothetical protein